MIRRKPVIGLLPCYLELYDRVSPDNRPEAERFVDGIAAALEKKGLEVSRAPFCRLAPEFARAVGQFEQAGVDALVTLHPAYSPSLEAAPVLSETDLPLVILNTTPDEGFGTDTPASRVFFNHGIHGVQDLCSVLGRMEKPFQLESGHWRASDVLERVAGRARSARLVSAFRGARVGRLGAPFTGMGDFLVEPETMVRDLGVKTVIFDRVRHRLNLPGDEAAEVEAEMERDRRLYDCSRVPGESHRLAVRSGLALRQWIEEEALTALTFNFLAVCRDTGLPTVPFLEAGKAMSRGLGYAGEGDTLTASLCGTLGACFPEVTFTEMFCPDWAGGQIFLSHMGEINPAIVSGKPLLLEKNFPYADCRPPVFAAGCLRAGKACLVNIAPAENGQFRLIVAPVEMTEGEKPGRMETTVRGWVKPGLETADFLTAYSRAGGTHHLVLVYGDNTADIIGFGKMMNWQTTQIG